MRSLFSKAVVAAAIMTVAIGGTTRAQSGDNDGCSNATLNGDYAFTVSGSFITTPPGGAPVTVQRLGVARFAQALVQASEVVAHVVRRDDRAPRVEIENSSLRHLF